MIFALSLFPLVAMVGVGVDVAFDLNAKTVLDGAADAAALAAATAAQSQLANGATQSHANTAGIAAAQAIFNADVVKISELQAAPAMTVGLTFDTANLKINSAVGYTAKINTVFGRIFGIANMNLSRTAQDNDLSTASIGMARFTQVTFAIDNSNSMGIGATTADINTLQSLTGCAFGCHFNDVGQPLSNETVAHNNGLNLRIDSIKNAVKTIISTVQTNEASFSPKRESFAMYTLDAELTGDSSLTPVRSLTASPTTDYASLLTLADNIDLAGYKDTGRGETGVGMGLRQLSPTVGVSGDGSTVQNPKKYLFVLTDGVEDLMMPQTEYTCRSSLHFDSSHCTAPFNSANCQSYKDNGVTVAVIYTTYLQVPYYVNFVQPFENEIVPNLQACASGAQWFAEASDGPSINAAIANFYQQALSSAVLTQ